MRAAFDNQWSTLPSLGTHRTELSNTSLSRQPFRVFNKGEGGGSPYEPRPPVTRLASRVRGSTGPAGMYLKGSGPRRRFQMRLGRRLEAITKAAGDGYCRLQMPLGLAAVETVAGHRLGPWRPGGVVTPPFQCTPDRCTHATFATSMCDICHCNRALSPSASKTEGVTSDR